MYIFNDKLSEDVSCLNAYLHNKYGTQQRLICCDELAELQQAINKVERNINIDNMSNLTEEIRDALIVICGLIDHYHISTRDIEKIMQYKCDRTNDLIKKGEL